MERCFSEIVQELEQIEDQNGRLKHTYAAAGFALYFSQLLEQEAIIYCILSRKIRHGWHVPDADHDRWDRELTKCTLGQLVKEIEGTLPSDSPLTAELHDALRVRNDLAHAFFKDGFGRRPVEIRLEPLVVKLMHIAETLHRAERSLETARNDALRRAGADMAWLDREVQRFMDGAGNGHEPVD